MKPRHLSLLLLVTLFASVFVWLLFYIGVPKSLGYPASGLNTVFANYDGPNYLVIAKCGYDFDCIRSNFSLPQPLEYYPAHLPGYPLLIRLLNTVFSGPWAMLLATLTGSLVLTAVFYNLACLYLKPKRAFLLSLIFIFFPARFFVLRLVGAPETWFLALTLFSIFFYKKNTFWLSALTAALAQTFKSPGILLFAAYGLLALQDLLAARPLPALFKKYYPYLLVPLSALIVFYFYYLQTGDFLAYFHSGDNFHLNPLPYTVFLSHLSWINTIWLEDIIYIFLLAFTGLYLLWKKYKLDVITVYTFVFLSATVLVAHRDISRYLAPAYPFLMIAYARILTKPTLRLIMFLLLPAILLYTVNFMAGNTAPVADWGPYL